MEDILSQLPGFIGAIAIYIGAKTVDVVLARLIGQKFFEPLWEKGKKNWKALKTRRDEISADFEFSIYTKGERSLEQAVSDYERVLQSLSGQSSDINISEKTVMWNRSKDESTINIQFGDNSEKYSLTAKFIPAQSDLNGEDVTSQKEALLSSIGITVNFSFAFSNLKSAIIDLVAFSDFVQSAFEEVYAVREVTNGKFVVSPIDNDLTMEDWVHDQQFDVSLLLKSDDQERSVRFRGDQAEIRSPTRQIDNETVEYIRATLLNYYL